MISRTRSARGAARVATLTAILLTLVMSLAAEPVAQLKPENYLSDFAHVIDANTAAQINSLCLEIDQKAHAQIAVVTIQSLEGRDIEGYAVELFKQWGVGSKATNRGVLILYAMQDRKSRIEVGYGLEPILPDGKVGGFQREAIPLMRQQNYSGALLLATQRVAGVIASDAGVQISNIPASSPSPRQGESSDKFPGALIFILVILVLFTPLRRILFWMLLGNLLGGGGYGRRGGGFGGGFGSGGGFGGFGGGGGFGGFGGGMSGGGGASSGW